MRSLESEMKMVRLVTAEVLKADPESLRERNRFIEDLGADSFELFEILTRIEETARISFRPDSLKEIRTLKDAAELLREVEHKG